MDNQPSRTESFLAPTSSAERVPVLDILRGFAVFGILLVNMNSFTYHRSYENATGWTWFLKAINRGAEQLVTQFGTGKFITLFSFLFGLGFALQLGRAEARGLSIAKTYARRLLVLLGIGLIHGFFIWEGDILVYYALTGFLLLLFRHCKPRTLLVCAALFYLLPVAKMEITLYQDARRTPSTQVGQSLRSQEGLASDNLEDETDRRVFRKGSMKEIEVRRIHNVLVFYRQALNEAPKRLALFLLGLYVGKRQVFRNMKANLAFFKRLGFIGLVVGLLGDIILYVLYHPSLPIWTSLLRPVAATMGILGLSSFYVSALTHLTEKDNWRQKLAPLAGVGRMALTNYLLQSIVYALLFYNYGLGLFERIEPATGLLMTIIAFVVELLLTKWWLKRFRFGPVEWIWRVLTYGKLQPMVLGS